MNQLTCFISYSWDSEDHCTWIRDHLAIALVKNGIFVHLDQWEVRPGDEVIRFMEIGIRESDYVLIVCTPLYAQKAYENIGGARNETSVVTGELFFSVCPEREKYVPILRIGNSNISLPSYLKAGSYIDFRKEYPFEKSMNELLRHLYQCPEYQLPKHGIHTDFKEDSRLGKKIINILSACETEHRLNNFLRDNPNVDWKELKKAVSNQYDNINSLNPTLLPSAVKLRARF